MRKLQKRLPGLLVAAMAMLLLPATLMAEANCSDGLDNDGDLAVDMEDSGCYSAGTIHYVSSSAGDDAWDGLAPVHTGGNNGPKQSLAAAQTILDSLNAGDKLLFRRGDSWDNFSAGVLTANDFQGTMTSPIVVGAYGSGARPRFNQHAASDAFLILGINNEWLQVRDLHLHGQSAGTQGFTILYWDGVSTDNPWPRYVTLDNVLVEHFNGSGLVNYGHDLTLQNSVIRFNNNINTGVTAHGMYTAADNVTVRNNTFEHNGRYMNTFDHQIYMSRCQNCVIEFNRFHNATDGVKVRRGNGNILRYNEFWDLRLASIVAGGDSDGPQNNLLITGNYFHDSGGGIALRSQSGPGGHGLHNAEISNNVFQTIDNMDASDPPGDPSRQLTQMLLIGGDLVSDIRIHHNVFYDPRDATPALDLLNSAPVDVRISNNIFHRSDGGRPIRILSLPDLSGVTFDHNLYHLEGSSTEIFLVDATVYPDLASFRTAYPSQAANGLEGDPEFVDPAAGDFHLTAASLLAIDQGESIASITLDRDQNLRPADAGYDLGAYEYNSSGGPTATPSPTPGPATPTPTPTRTPTAAPEAGTQENPEFLSAWVIPNPLSGSQGSFQVELRGQAERVEVEAFSPAYTKLGVVGSTGPSGPGRSTIPLNLENLPSNFVYFRATAYRGEHRAVIVRRGYILR